MEDFTYILYYIIIPFVSMFFVGLLYLNRNRYNSKQRKQYEYDVKENSDFPTSEKENRILYILSVQTDFGIQYYVGCNKDDKSACSQNIEEAAIFQTKKIADYVRSHSRCKFEITEIDISEVENYFFPQIN